MFFLARDSDDCFVRFFFLLHNGLTCQATKKQQQQDVTLIYNQIFQLLLAAQANFFQKQRFQKYEYPFFLTTFWTVSKKNFVVHSRDFLGKLI